MRSTSRRCRRARRSTQALARLPGRKFIFTNGSIAHADRVMGRLGVSHHFEGVFDIVAADYQPKPDPATYAQPDPPATASSRGEPPWSRTCRAICGPAAALGMTTVLVADRRGMGRGRRIRRSHPPCHRRSRRLARPRNVPQMQALGEATVSQGDDAWISASCKDAIDAAWDKRDGINASTRGEVDDAVEAALAGARFRQAPGRREDRRQMGHPING